MADFSDANLSYADLGKAILENADFSNAVLNGANISEANIGNCNFYACQLVWRRFYGAIMDSVDLTGADLTGLKYHRRN
jgi:uncharacterized protein YjbI with pentapeptide repeats